MRATICSTFLQLLVIVAAGFAPGCRRAEETGSRPSAGSSGVLASDRRDPSRLARVRAGMTEGEVAAVLGPPDEVRIEDGRRPWIAGARFAWAYGVLAPGGFAAGGHVLFGDARRVTMTRSPIDADPVRPAGTRLPWSETAIPTAGGLSCHLEITAMGALGPEARVTLRNDGPIPFERRHGHTGIVFNLILEIFDGNRRLIGRVDTLSSFSPYAPGDTEVMRIQPGGSLSELVHLGVRWTEFGLLPPGTYFARAAFPFEDDRFSPSELVPIHIAAALP